MQIDWVNVLFCLLFIIGANIFFTAVGINNPVIPFIIGGVAGLLFPWFN